MSATTHIRFRGVIVAAAAFALATAAPATAASYQWPVKPFNRQHPVRGFFGDPRIGVENGRVARQLHFGIDISASNGTPVYATLSGRIVLHPLHADVVEVCSGATTFEYWHIVPARTSGSATAYQTILGYVEKPWAHVHFSERLGNVYVNPLRPGALSPYADDTRPSVHAISFERNGMAVGRRELTGHTGRVDIVAEVLDETPLPVPAPWNAKPVVPALVEWRIGAGSPWRVAVDFRYALPASPFEAVYAKWTRQNVASRYGRYRFVLARDIDVSAIGSGTNVLQVRVVDTRGNVSIASKRFGVGAARV
jgi:hypothetical protein